MRERDYIAATNLAKIQIAELAVRDMTIEDELLAAQWRETVTKLAYLRTEMERACRARARA